MLLLMSSVAGASAQESVYVYRNDGGFDAFFRADIDSITYSHIGADSMYHADWQMQLVHTPDSVYRIPLSAIDSVSLVAPEPVLNADVFRLTAAHDPYLLNADTLSFVLKAGTPADMRPAKGNVVVSAADCMAFPYGIMARVLSVNGTADGGFEYVCEPARLEDIYDRLVVYGKCVSGEDGPSAVRGKALGDVDASIDYTLWSSDFEKEITADGTTACISAHDAASATITIKLIRGQSSYFRFDLRNDFKSSISFNANSTAGLDKEWQLGRTLKLNRIYIPGTLVWLTPRISLYGYFSEQGEVNLDFGAHLDRSDVFSLICENGKWSYGYKPLTDAGVDVASLSMRGSVEVGLRPDILFGLCGSATGLGFVYRVGLKESADFKFDALEYVQNGGVYAALRDCYARTTVPQSVNAYAQIGLFGPSVRWDMPPFRSEPQWGSDKYLLPLFGETTAAVGKDHRSATLRTDVSRDLLLPVELGYSVFDKDEELVERKYLSVKYQTRNGWPLNGVETNFTGLKSGETYTAYPTVRIMGLDMTAVPSKEFKLDEEMCPDENHPHLIDLGLPGGTKWACCNVGASKPEGYGGYYAWGETEEKSVYNWDTYLYGSDWDGCVHIGNEISGTKYDVARVKWGAPWRMPTLAEIQALLDNCTREWTQLNGVDGIRVTGPNGNSVFLPAAGDRWDESLGSDGSGGDYWSGTLGSGGGSNAHGLSFGSGNWGWSSYDRGYGHSVRPVAE